MSNYLETDGTNWKVEPEENDVLLQTSGMYVERNIKIMGVDLSPYAKTASGTVDGIAYYTSNNEITSTGTGTSGQILSSTGDGAPAWISAATLDEVKAYLTS